MIGDSTFGSQPLEEDYCDSAEVPPSLYLPLVARQPLTFAEWARVPAPSPGLGAVLPAVLMRSKAEAEALVAHLPEADRQRLRTAALCLARAQRRCRVHLPAELAGPQLAAAVDDLRRLCEWSSVPRATVYTAALPSVPVTVVARDVNIV